MKTKLCILLLCAYSILGFAQQNSHCPKPQVDKQVELMSIVFRLAGNREYNDNSFKLYTDKIHSWFAPYKEHELIQLATKLRNERGVSYDAVMGLAVRLDDRLNLSDTARIDTRWDRTKLKEFVNLLKKFKKETEFDKFYAQNLALYTEASRRFLPIYDELDLEWYRNFYGQEPKESYIIINSMSNGGGNYGASVDGKDGHRNVYAIMGSWSVDSVGMIHYPRNAYFPILLHEFNHSFVNHLIEANLDSLRASGEQIIALVGEQMRRQAYGAWQTVFSESLVRAAVIIYMKDHNFLAGQIEQEISMQKSRGFVWIGKLVNELETYADQRSEYPTLESYMPRLVEAHAGFAQYTATYDSLRPKVTSISEFSNGDTTVRSDIKSITIHFDRPLVGRGYSFNYGALGQDAMPTIKSVSYANDNSSVIVEVELKPECHYQMVLLGLSFRTPDGDGMKPYEISFKTVK